MIRRAGSGVRIGPVFIAKQSLGLAIGDASIGVFGRQTLDGALTGWALRASSLRLNRCWSMNIDRPTIGRYRW